jgi:hypothetical protein
MGAPFMSLSSFLNKLTSSLSFQTADPNFHNSTLTALISILSISIPTTYLLASVYPAQLLPIPTPISLLLGPVHAPPPPTADSPRGRAMTEKLEQGVWELDVVKQCKELVETGEWYETRKLLHSSRGAVDDSQSI